MSQEEKERLYKNLVILLKMFKSRPNHLAKYLIDNSAFNPKFIKKILESDKLKDISKNDDTKDSTPYFSDINQMNDFYNSIIDDIKLLSQEKSTAELTKELNNKLDSYIKAENYEDAARVRDYMNRSGIERIK